MAEFSGLANMVQAEMASQGVSPQAHVQAIGGQQPSAAGQPPAPAPAPAAPTQASTPAPQPDVQAHQQPTDAANAAPEGLQVPQPVRWEIPDDALVDLGNGEIVPARELRRGGLRLADYTRKTQEVAAVRAEAEKLKQAAERAAVLEQERVQLSGFLEDPSAVVRYAVQSWGPEGVVQQLQALGVPLGQAQAAVAQAVADNAAAAAPAPPAATIQDLQATVAYLQHQLSQQQAQFQQEAAARTEQLIQQTIDRIEDAKAIQAYEAAIDTEIDTLVNSDPFLTANPVIKDYLKFRVLQEKPQTFEELQTILRTEAQAQVARLEQAAQARLRLSAPAQAQAVAQQASQYGIEPPGGAAPQPAPLNVWKADGSADWKALNNAVTAYLQQHSQGQ